MADEPENLILAYLRCFDQQLSDMRGDIRKLALRVGALEQRFSALEARFASLEEQLIVFNQRWAPLRLWRWMEIRPSFWSRSYQQVWPWVRACWRVWPPVMARNAAQLAHVINRAS